LDRSQAIIFQGFSHNCIHVDKTSWIPPYPIRKPFPPKNALLSVEEDEFLCHVAELFDFDRRTELVNNIRYCSISIYSAATCDRDMFNVFGVLAEVDVTCDRGKFSARSSVTSLLM
jgi:hypothetical protein